MSSGEKDRTENVIRPVISIVDDDPSVRRATASLCESAGYDTHTFDSAESFLESGFISTSDCLLLDLELPGMSGLELLVAMARNHRRLPIVMTTASTDPNVRRRALEAGASAFLLKVEGDEQLLDEIQRALGGSSE